MFKKIVVPLDGSTLAEKALTYAVRLANRLEANLILVRVVEGPIFKAKGALKAQAQAKIAAEYLNELQEFMTVKAEGPSLNASRLRTCLLNGKPAMEICHYVQDEQIDLVVMTTHGRTGLSRLVTGSLATNLLHELPVPILVVRPFGLKHSQSLPEAFAAQDEPYSNTFLVDGMRLLLPLDKTLEAQIGLDLALDLAKKLGATLYLLKVNLPVNPILYGEVAAFAYSSQEEAHIEQSEKDQALLYLEQFAKLARQKGIETFKQVLTGEPASKIVEYANEIDPDLIVMATHAPSEIGRFIVGSVADEVMRTTNLPVLMVPLRQPAYTR